ncbi:hypothetical protein [Ignavibacterium sp.]|uniref:hypothetical protein n=1 Tax=Ignavibacterium sp. TaxID=2651167 RepID=UPI00307FB943
MRIKSFLILLLSLLIIGCCGQSMTIKDSSITIDEANCWLNLMPGGNPSFHYSGTFSINKNLADDYKLKQLYVFYKDNLIHSSQPLLQFYDEIVTDSSSLIRFNFYSEQGIKVTETMMQAENLDLLLVFEIQGKTIEKAVKEIPLTRAY